MKTLKFCEVCGVSSETKIVSFDTKTQKILCQKHRCQFKNHNIFFDNSQITQADLNEISTNIENNIAYIHLYNKYGIELYKTKIDLEDVDKVKNKKMENFQKSK